MVKQKNRIFILGDSFSHNSFKMGYYEYLNPNKFINISPITEYVKILIDNDIDMPLWFSDWLELWGYDVYNFGIPGCSIEGIIYQFGKIDKNYRSGDRIILHLTNPDRFNWLLHNGIDIGYVMPSNQHFGLSYKTSEILNDQCILRENSFKSRDGYLHKNLFPFIEYIIEIHSKYKPIVWSIFNANTIFLYNRWYSHIFTEKILGQNKKITTISDETNGRINDGHFGRYGNYYLGIIFDEIIKTNKDGNYLDDNLSSVIRKRIENSYIEFKNPEKWMI